MILYSSGRSGLISFHSISLHSSEDGADEFTEGGEGGGVDEFTEGGEGEGADDYSTVVWDIKYAHSTPS